MENNQTATTKTVVLNDYNTTTITVVTDGEQNRTNLIDSTNNQSIELNEKKEYSLHNTTKNKVQSISLEALNKLIAGQIFLNDEKEAKRIETEKNEEARILVEKRNLIELSKKEISEIEKQISVLEQTETNLVSLGCEVPKQIIDKKATLVSEIAPIMQAKQTIETNDLPLLVELKTLNENQVLQTKDLLSQIEVLRTQVKTIQTGFIGLRAAITAKMYCPPTNEVREVKQKTESTSTDLGGENWKGRLALFAKNGKFMFFEKEYTHETIDLSEIKKICDLKTKEVIVSCIDKDKKQTSKKTTLGQAAYRALTFGSWNSETKCYDSSYANFGYNTNGIQVIAPIV